MRKLKLAKKKYKHRCLEKFSDQRIDRQGRFNEKRLIILVPEGFLSLSLGAEAPMEKNGVNVNVMQSKEQEREIQK